MLNKKIASEIAVGIILILALVIGGIFWLQGQTQVTSNQSPVIGNQKSETQKPSEEQVFCTQEAKQCADGSYVGRKGSNCEFEACPNENRLDSERISPLIKKYNIKEFTFAESQKISKIEKQSFKVLDHFSIHDRYDKDRNLVSVGLSELGIECSTQKSDQYYADLLSKFDNNDVGAGYKIYYKGESNVPYYTVTVIPNKPNYSNSEGFKEDFGTCYAGGQEYPYLAGENYLLFVSSCGSGFGYENDLPYGCDEIKEDVESTLKVF